MTILLLISAGSLARAADEKNVVLNGDFSQVENGKPVGWAASGDQYVVQTLEIVSEEGRRCARLACTRCEKRTPSSHAMLAQVGAVKVERGKLYELSFRARAEGMRGRTISVALNDMNGWNACGLSAEFRLGRSWRQFREVFRASRSADKTSRLQFWYVEPGTFYLSDVRIAEVSQQAVEFADVVPPTDSKNLVFNSSFEAGGAGWTSLGRGAGWGNLQRLHGNIETTGGTEGRSFLRIPLGGDNTPVLYFDYLRPVVRRELQTLAAGCGWIPVTKDAAYTISCDMRASVDGTPAILGVRAKDPEAGSGTANYSQKVALSKSWKRYTFTFRPARRYVFPTIGPDLESEVRVDVDLDAVQLEPGDQATAFAPRSAVEIGVAPSEAGGVLTQGKPASLRVTAFNHGATPQSARVEFEGADFFDKPVSLPALSLELPAASSLLRDCALPAEWKGYYRIRATCSATGKTDQQNLRLAIVPPRASDDSVLGLNHAFVTSYLIQQARKAGVAWYRDWSLKWQDLEPSPGDYRWEVGDAQIDRVLKEGVKLMALMPPFPSSRWASEASADLPSKGYPGERLREAWAPKDPPRLGEFIARTVARYKDRLHVWEFLNEPIYTDYALPGQGRSEKYPGKAYSVADYVQLLKVAAAGMRKGDPTCKVMGGVAGPPTQMTRELIEAGCLDLVDIFNLHMYPGARLPESYLPEMDTLLKTMDEHGGRKPIWITEISYYGADDPPRRPFLANKNNWSEDRLLGSERECAELTIRYFTVMLARGVQKIFIHAGSCGPVNEPNFECCLFAYGGAPRKVFPALAVFTELIGPNPRFAGEKSLGENAYAFAFETGKRAMLVLWTSDEDLRRTVAVPSSATECLDAMGGKIPAGPVALSTTPVYVLGPAGAAKSLVSSLGIE